MKSAIFIVLAGVIVAVASELTPGNVTQADLYDILTKYGYSTNDNNTAERVTNLMKCIYKAYVNRLDPNATHKYNATKRCCLTAAEHSKQKNHKISAAAVNQRINGGSAASAGRTHEIRGTAPPSIDWRALGAVSSVKDQGECGSCYTFAAAAALEGAYFNKHGVLLNISTQQYVDCSSGYTLWFVYSSATNSWVPQSTVSKTGAGSGNAGCDGGMYQQCWGYNQYQTNQNLWSCYGYSSNTYNGVAGTCNVASCGTQVQVTGYVSVSSEAQLLNAVGTVGPVACALDADTLSPYHSGVFNGDGCTTTSDHAITVVGYGTDATAGPYWIVKNSWGAGWGEKGYFRIARGSNTCGIGTNYCAYPTVA